MIRKNRSDGYTLIELTMVIVIISVLASIVVPQYAVLTQRAYQSKAKGNLGSLRSALSLYYSEQDGLWPLKNYPGGPVTDGNSLTTMLTPRYMATVPIPRVVDNMPDYNGLSFSYDSHAINLMTQNPVSDVWIVAGQPADWTPGVEGPYGYDYESGAIYYANGNYDAQGTHYIYEW